MARSRNRVFTVMMAATLAGSMLGAAAPTSVLAAKNYANCTKLNKDYPHGVGKPGARDKVDGQFRPGRSVTNFKVSTALYSANKGKDRDGDKIACEKR